MLGEPRLAQTAEVDEAFATSMELLMQGLAKQANRSEGLLRDKAPASSVVQRQLSVIWRKYGLE
jgi:hypothetical protein